MSMIDDMMETIMREFNERRQREMENAPIDESRMIDLPVEKWKERIQNAN